MKSAVPSVARTCLTFGNFHLLIVVSFVLAGFQAKAVTWQASDTSDTFGNTLRGDIHLSNLIGGSNTIVLTKPVYHLTLKGADEDAGLTGDLDIIKGNLTIIGAASGQKTTIDASGLGDRVFQVLAGAQLTISNVVVTGGTAPAGKGGPSGSNGEDGGGIYNAGKLILDGCIASENAGGDGGSSDDYVDNGGNGGRGGGIFNVNKLLLKSSVVSRNLSGAGGSGTQVEGNVGSNEQGGNGGDGGGVYNAGTAIFENSIVIENTNGTGGATLGNGGNGGGIYNTGLLAMTNTIVTNNSSGSDGYVSGSGGGIFNGGLATLDHSAVNGNWIGAAGVINGWSIIGGGDGGSGGGIFNSGNILLNFCTISDNSGGFGGGGGQEPFDGGIGSKGGGLCNTNIALLNSCMVSGNSAGIGGVGGADGGFLSSPAGSGGLGGDGGGIYNQGALTLSLCVVFANTSGRGGNAGRGNSSADNAGFGGDGGNGGGIYNDGGNLTLTLCTISGNSTGNGGIGDGGPASRGGNGGGLWSDGTIGLVACTVVENQCGTGASSEGWFTNYVAIPGMGGGIFIETNAQLSELSDSLVALNQTLNSSLISFDVSGNFISHGYNLISQADGSTGLTNGVNHDLVGSANAPIDPKLGPLQDNGGPTFTHALLAGSPAIDQGKSFGLTTDQRGRARTYDFYSITNAVGGDGSDIGAYEVDSPFLFIQRQGANVDVAWDNSGFWFLQESTNLSGGWQTYNIFSPTLGTNTMVHHTYNASAGQIFFRLTSSFPIGGSGPTPLH